MSFNDLNADFEKYLNERFSPEERKEFLRWLTLEGNEERVKEYLFQQLKHYQNTEDIKEVDFERIFFQISQEINNDSIPFKENKKRRIIISIAKVAAIAFIAVVSTLLVSRMTGPRPFSKMDVRLCEIKAPLGSKTELTLPDGSRVWLNGGSKLKYPALFSSDTRDVFLDGEAYFDVSENKAKPFLVHATFIQIKVLGTAFNVKSYSEDKTIETTLVRGSIEIREIKGNMLTEPLLIKPNQKAVFIKSKKEITANSDFSQQKLKEVPNKLPAIEIDKVNTVPITAWKEKTLVFDNITLDEIVVSLERWYGIKINIMNKSLKKYHYNGRFSHNETIYQVLEVLKVTTPITYELKNYEINIDMQKN